MSIVGLDHVQLAMPEGGEKAARAFYGGLLGLAEVPKPPHLAVRGGCWFERGTVKVHLGVERDFAPARKAHVAFLVRDLPSLRQRLVEGGGSRPRTTNHWKGTSGPTWPIRSGTGSS